MKISISHGVVILASEPDAMLIGTLFEKETIPKFIIRFHVFNYDLINIFLPLKCDNIQGGTDN